MWICIYVYMYIYIYAGMYVNICICIWGPIVSCGHMCPHEVENCAPQFASVPRMVGISSYAPASAFSNRQEVKRGTSETGVFSMYLTYCDQSQCGLKFSKFSPAMMHMKPKLGTFWWWSWWSTIGQNWLPCDPWFWDAMPPAAWESPFEAYHQYLVEHPEVVLAHYQRHCPNASGMRICTESGVGCWPWGLNGSFSCKARPDLWLISYLFILGQ